MMRVPTCLVMIAAAAASSAWAADEAADSGAQQTAEKIDEFLARHWEAQGIAPAAPADDATFLRRLTLDLAGRIPTMGEVDRFLADTGKDKRRQLIRQLIDGPEFPLHLGNVLDEMIQERYAGNEAFVDYLRRSLRDGKPWDALFTEMLVGPWDEAGTKAANRFLDKRARDLDGLTADATRVFFGVDISCAKCHDHPLVEDWKQDHYYGMASFFNRTTGGKGKVGEKNEGEVKFLGSDGKEKTARMMFLTGLVVDEPAAGEQPQGQQQAKPPIRRRQLVNAALQEQTIFSRALVNRLWEYYFGRGLIDPVDQLHSGNPPAVDGLLEWLAEDFAASGYDIRRLIFAIVSTRAYALGSEWSDDATVPAETAFAVAHLRPLGRRQLAFSLLLTTGGGDYDRADDATQRVERYIGIEGLDRIRNYLALETQGAELIGAIDPRERPFQSSTSEALFVSNNERVQELVRPAGENLVVRLSRLETPEAIVEAAVKGVLSRPAGEAERAELAEWFARQEGERADVCGRLVWALLASAEFRFNH